MARSDAAGRDELIQFTGKHLVAVQNVLTPSY